MSSIDKTGIFSKISSEAYSPCIMDGRSCIAGQPRTSPGHFLFKVCFPFFWKVLTCFYQGIGLSNRRFHGCGTVWGVTRTFILFMRKSKWSFRRPMFKRWPLLPFIVCYATFSHGCVRSVDWLRCYLPRV